jgi:hypothetical protein
MGGAAMPRILDRGLDVLPDDGAGGLVTICWATVGRFEPEARIGLT